MPLQVSQIISRASLILNDVDPPHVRWTKPELVGWINEGAGEIIIHRPAAGSVTGEIETKAGPYQTIPEDGIALLDVVRNLPGGPINRADRYVLDEQDPGWYEAKPAKKARHYSFDERNPKGFYLYPVVEEGTKIEALFSRSPQDVEDEDDTLDLDDIYIGPLVSYVLYRAFSKDSQFADGQVAIAHHQAFMQAMGVQNQTSMATSPRGPINEGA